MAAGSAGILLHRSGMRGTEVLLVHPGGPFWARKDLGDLGSVKLKSGKIVVAFAVAGDLDPASVRSNTFPLEWPPRSGRMQEFPEIDRAEWFELDAARAKLNPAQAELIDRLEALLAR